MSGVGRGMGVLDAVKIVEGEGAVLGVNTRRDGRRNKCGLQSTTDRRRLIAVDVQLCVHRDGRLGVRHRHAGPTGDKPPTVPPDMVNQGVVPVWCSVMPGWDFLQRHV